MSGTTKLLSSMTKHVLPGCGRRPGLPRPVLVAALAVLPGIGTGSLGGEPVDPFADAAHVPGDVSLYLHVQGVADLSRKLEGRPIEGWMTALLADAKAPQAWTDLAGRMDMEPRRLFDLVFGGHLTLVRRATPDGGGTWAVLSEVEPERLGPLHAKMRARFLGVREGTAVWEWPEHALLVGRLGPALIVGPSTRPGLFNELLHRMAAGPPARATALASDPRLARARELGKGRIGLLLRHDPPLGGWSALVADLEGDTVRLRQAGEFENDPFERRITTMKCDFSPIRTLEGKTLLTVLEPMDVGAGPLETFVTSLLGEPLLSEPIRARLGDLRIIAVGEEEGRQRSEPVDVLAPTFTLCLSIEPDSTALEDLDRRMVSLAASLNRAAEGTFVVDQPVADAVEWPRGRPREMDISAISAWLPGGEPVMGNVTLNWTVTDGPLGSWYVIATHPRALQEVADSLGCPDHDPGCGPVGTYDSVGSADGTRISRHLRSWAERAELVAAPGEHDAFRETVALLAKGAEGVDRCCWKLARPAPRQMQLEVRLELAPRRSADHP